MPYLTPADKVFFREQGFLVKQEVLSPEQIAAAQDALWEGIRADRRDPQTWIKAGPRVPVGANHAAIRATLHESPVFEMAEELVGAGPDSEAGPARHHLLDVDGGPDVEDAHCALGHPVGGGIVSVEVADARQGPFGFAAGEDQVRSWAGVG